MCKFKRPRYTPCVWFRNVSSSSSINKIRGKWKLRRLAKCLKLRKGHPGKTPRGQNSMGWPWPCGVLFINRLKLWTLMSYLRKSFGKRSHLVNGWKSFSGPFPPSDRIAPDWFWPSGYIRRKVITSECNVIMPFWIAICAQLLHMPF